MVCKNQMHKKTLTRKIKMISVIQMTKVSLAGCAKMNHTGIGSKLKDTQLQKPLLDTRSIPVRVGSRWAEIRLAH